MSTLARYMRSLDTLAERLQELSGVPADVMLNPVGAYVRCGEWRAWPRGEGRVLAQHTNKCSDYHTVKIAMLAETLRRDTK